MYKENFNSKMNNAISHLTACGLPFEQSKIVADCLITADMYGVSSHGIGMLNAHIEKIKNGNYNLKPDIKTIRETASFSVIDGDNAIGPYSASYCMNYAIKKCKDVGVYTVFSRNNNTLGAAFFYSLMAANDNCIGIVLSNSPAQMAPFGGKEKMLGTNPFSIVIPCGNKDPIIIDMATSIVAKSKFREYKDAEKNLPQGWALNKDGYPTTDPNEALEGLILPMAGFKGYGISMMIDILSGVLSGAAFLNKVGRFYDTNKNGMNVGFCFIAIDPKIVFGEDYEKTIEEYVDILRKSKHIEGKSICLPGDDRIKTYKNNTSYLDKKE